MRNADDQGQFVNPRYIINFPTKSHWRENSKIDEVEAGLYDLQSVIREYGVRSVAVPPLGCGNGGLDWNIVRPLIVGFLSQFDEVRILIYEPVDALRWSSRHGWIESF